ncbi:GNAT family N-acetyltransferase [Altererythrobacter sp.]|uniref:GNAT family N-acetyltransferase n=1 Tax=Altererythrobacter sp. TaxID=1872480 RepID=UPI003CFC03E4
MATAALDIYETTLDQAVYETSLDQVLIRRANGVHLLDADDVAREAFQAEWQELVDQSAEPNPFFEPWFLIPSLQLLDPGRRVRIAAYYQRGELCGLIPLSRSASYYGYPLPCSSTWLHPNAFSGVPLVRQGHEEPFWQEVLHTLDTSPGGALFLHLPGIPEAGPVNRALESVAARQHRSAGIVASEERALLQSDLDPETYFEATLSSKKRKELRRQKRRLGEEGELTFERHDCETGLDDWISEFLSLEAAGWKGDAGSALAEDHANARFFTNALKGAASRGRLERLALRLDGKPMAMLVNFLAAPGAFGFKTAFDERYSRFSPGVLLQQENLHLLARDGIEWCDSCANEGHPMIERIWREKRRIVSQNVAIGGGLRRKVFERLLRAEMKEEIDA